MEDIKELKEKILNNKWFCIGVYDEIDPKELYQELKQIYKYFVTCKDKFLSGWGYAEHGASYQMIFCKDSEELNKVINNLRARDREFSYINWNYTNNKRALYNYLNKYIVTLRNDFKN